MKESSETAKAAYREGYDPIIVSPENPEYRRAMQKKRDSCKDEAVPFGKGLFSFDTHALLKKYLKKNQPIVMSEIRLLFREALADKRITQHPFVQQLTRGFVGDFQAPGKLLAAYRNNEMPDEVFKLAIAIHIENYDSSSARLEEELPGLRNDFTKGLSRLLSDPKHPLTEDMVTVETVNQRLDDIAVIIGDPLQMFSTDTGENLTGGGFKPGKSQIEILYDTPTIQSDGKSYHSRLYDHEAMHAISGRSPQRLPTPEGFDPIFDHPRIGVKTNNSYFSWLNEAITETLAQDVYLGKRDLNLGSYASERKIYNGLISRVPEELFLRAYFENSADGDDQRLHWQELISSATKEFGRDILTDIAEEIDKEKDTEAGVKILHDTL